MKNQKINQTKMLKIMKWNLWMNPRNLKMNYRFKEFQNYKQYRPLKLILLKKHKIRIAN